MIRVLLADDQHLVRQAMAALLSFEADIEVVGEAARGDEVLAAVAECSPDVVLLDIEMPGRDGLTVAEDLHAAGLAVKVVILTTFGRPGYLHRALASGASGFVVKDARAEELADAIRRVHAGQRVVDRALAASSRTRGASPFTARERDVLRVATDGGTIADIARELFLSEGTVRNYLSSAMGKVGARTRAEAVRVAENNGWL
ncbi:response regulator transcription factor [Sphaerimonospora mesophila]|uniref:response regulator transcription factor n=1 Tax=Sphaerimonospora mesophila TaxID=37483 RepID=UPI0006E1B389